MKRRATKTIREGRYSVQVEVELIDTGDGWSPYLALEDAYRLDDIRQILRAGKMHGAGTPWYNENGENHVC